MLIMVLLPGPSIRTVWWQSARLFHNLEWSYLSTSLPLAFAFAETVVFCSSRHLWRCTAFLFPILWWETPTHWPSQFWKIARFPKKWLKLERLRYTSSCLMNRCTQVLSHISQTPYEMHTCKFLRSDMRTAQSNEVLEFFSGNGDLPVQRSYFLLKVAGLERSQKHWTLLLHSTDLLW